MVSRLALQTGSEPALLRPCSTGPALSFASYPDSCSLWFLRLAAHVGAQTHSVAQRGTGWRMGLAADSGVAAFATVATYAYLRCQQQVDGSIAGCS